MVAVNGLGLLSCGIYVQSISDHYIQWDSKCARVGLGFRMKGQLYVKQRYQLWLPYCFLASLSLVVTKQSNDIGHRQMGKEEL